MKQNFSLLLTVLFIAVAIWLSFSVKQSKKQLAAAENNLKVLSRENDQFKYRLDRLHEAFELNFNVPVRFVKVNLRQRASGFRRIPILYLKPYACSPCNLPVIKAIFKHLHSKEDFLIVSHTTNRHFLSEVLEEESVSEEERVVWLDSPLYEGDNGYDAELLFVDNQNRQVGCLPLELIKEESLFKKLMETL